MLRPTITYFNSFEMISTSDVNAQMNNRSLLMLAISPYGTPFSYELSVGEMHKRFDRIHEELSAVVL